MKKLIIMTMLLIGIFTGSALAAEQPYPDVRSYDNYNYFIIAWDTEYSAIKTAPELGQYLNLYDNENKWIGVTKIANIQLSETSNHYYVVKAAVKNVWGNYNTAKYVKINSVRTTAFSTSLSEQKRIKNLYSLDMDLKNKNANIFIDEEI